jgi:hypothetical protein
MNSEGAAFLKKSGAKNFYLFWSREFDAPKAQINKVFLLLFLQKKKFLLYLLHH